MENRGIPKVIHYCWFGGGEMPPLAYKCIESWHKFLPDFEIKRWDESNFDVSIIPYVSEAYKEGNYAFVSDYARVWIIYNYGGIYFDVDVEVVSPIYDIIGKGCFMGLDDNLRIMNVCLGLGFGGIKKLPILKQVLDIYANMNFILEDGSHNSYGIVPLVTDLLKKNGLKEENRVQTVENITVYPWDYFCPINYTSGEIKITQNTRTIHHFTSLWMPSVDQKANYWRWRLKWLRYPLNASVGRIIATFQVYGIKRFFPEIMKWLRHKN